MKGLVLAICVLYSMVAQAQPVSPAGSGTRDGAAPAVMGGELIARLETDRTTAYVNEQILVTLSIGAPSIAFNITGEELVLDNAEVRQLNRQQSTADINGLSHQFTKTVFAVFAREAGTLHIPALSFKGVLPVSAGGQGFSKGNPTVSASTSALTVEIEPEPLVTDVAWFPARHVAVESNWSVDITAPDAVRAGEPVTRHVTIKVAGQHPGAVPELQSSLIDNVRTYPDLPRLDTAVAVDGLNGTLTQSYAIVASNPGRVSLPPIDIHWWDINERQWQITTLPAEQIVVAESTLDNASAGQSQSKRYQIALAAMGMVVLGLLTCCSALLWHIRKQGAHVVTTSVQRHSSERVAWAALQRDVRNRNFNGVRRSLIDWAGVIWPSKRIQRLDQIPLQDRQLQDCLLSLDAWLFSGKASAEPDMDMLNTKLHSIRKAERKREKVPDGLSVLYPGARIS